MRFLLSLTFIFIISLNTFSQAWVDCGLKGGFGITNLVNGNVWNESKIDPLISTGHTYGGKLGLNFNLNYQITVDFLTKSSNQKYLFQPSQNNPKREKKIQYNSFDIPLLFRHNSDNGSFMEVGPQISILMGISETTENNSIENRKDYFEATNLGAVFGFGSFIMGNDNTYLIFGLRIHYGFQDLLSQAGGKNSNNYFPINNEENFEFKNYKPTNPLSGIIYLELNYDLAYLVSSKCKRTVIRFF